jgi:hypothetical protein
MVRPNGRYARMCIGCVRMLECRLLIAAFWWRGVRPPRAAGVRDAIRPSIGVRRSVYRTGERVGVMRTIMYSCLITVSLMLNYSGSVADDKSQHKAAEELLRATNVEKSMTTVMDQMLAVLIQQNPQLGPYHDVIKRFMSKYLSLESLQEELITIYTEEFTEEELEQLTAFYQTPVGKKAIEKLPQLTARAGQLGIARVQANQAELQRMIEEEKTKKGKSH